VQKFGASIEAAGSEIASKTSELKSATSVRTNENGDFKAAEKELVEAIDTLSRAVTIIKREMSFVQAGKKSSVAAKLQAMSGALQQVISAAYLSSDSRNQLKAFLSTDMDDELTLKAKQPQAASYTYESHSKGIVETLEDMKDKAEANLNSLRREEMKGKHAFELIKQSLTDANTNLNKQIDEATSASSAAQEKLGKAQGDLASTGAAKKADEEYVAKLTGECNAKASEWGERQSSAKSEMEALNKGSEILSAKFGAFVQTSVAVAVKKINAQDATREKAISVLKKLGRQFNSFAMMQIAGAAAKDPFAKVRGLIESMIAKLETQAQEEATHDAFCKEETAKSAKAKEMKQAGVEKLQARIDEANAGVAELKNEVSTLTSEIAEIVASMKKATEMRNTEHADFLVASKDFKESAEAITQALVVLKDFYKGGEAFIQQAPEFGSSKSDGAHMILEILEVAQEDFTKLLAEAETSEAESVEAFKALVQDNDVSKAKKEASVTAKTSEIKSVEVALTHHSEDYETVSAELDAVMDYISKLKPQCESKAMSYEERKARRDAEIAGLQEALTILSGDDVAAFIQKSARGFMQKKL
jgi:chromosome segregation ATPase